MIIKRAEPNQYDAVREFYHSVIDGLADMEYGAGWKKDIYPEPNYLKTSINKGELYIGLKEDKIIGAMVFNQDCNESYKEFQWPTQAEVHQVMVIHALGILPQYGGKGYGKKMVQFAIETAKKAQQRVLRLDVLKGNLPAEKLYLSMGFVYLHTLPMFYEDTGWTDYQLYEYKL